MQNWSTLIIYGSQSSSCSVIINWRGKVLVLIYSTCMVFTCTIGLTVFKDKKTLIRGVSLGLPLHVYKREHYRTRRWTWSYKMTLSNLITPTVYCTEAAHTVMDSLQLAQFLQAAGISASTACKRLLSCFSLEYRQFQNSSSVINSSLVQLITYCLWWNRKEVLIVSLRYSCQLTSTVSICRGSLTIFSICCY